ncbi:MAG: hypothetical protein RLZZ214_2067 [Verrucomicrobiota bacterium]|jgi:hypothetical protein
MKSWRSIILVVIALVVVGNWISRRMESNAPFSSPVPENKPAKPTVASVPAVTPSAEIPQPPPVSPDPAAPKPRSEESRAASQRDLESPLIPFEPSGAPPPRRAVDSDPEVAADFDKISLMLRDYRALAGENPVGTNAEIMKSLMGGNPKGAQLGPTEGQTINENGELLDRWGTPYFFHQLSKDLMEIHSAGPDRRTGNRDDIVSD